MKDVWVVLCMDSSGKYDIWGIYEEHARARKEAHELGSDRCKVQKHQLTLKT